MGDAKTRSTIDYAPPPEREPRWFVALAVLGCLLGIVLICYRVRRSIQ